MSTHGRNVSLSLGCVRLFLWDIAHWLRLEGKQEEKIWAEETESQGQRLVTPRSVQGRNGEYGWNRIWKPPAAWGVAMEWKKVPRQTESKFRKNIRCLTRNVVHGFNTGRTWLYLPHGRSLFLWSKSRRKQVIEHRHETMVPWVGEQQAGSRRRAGAFWEVNPLGLSLTDDMWERWEHTACCISILT